MLVRWQDDGQSVNDIAVRVSLPGHALSPLLARMDRAGLLTPHAAGPRPPRGVGPAGPGGARPRRCGAARPQALGPLRTAHRRVVLAVPSEHVPYGHTLNADYGHVHAFTAAHLRALRVEAGPGWSVDVHEHHGGWVTPQECPPTRGEVSAHVSAHVIATHLNRAITTAHRRAPAEIVLVPGR